ncbi:unnamed protein product [Parajaminaea phylloscopi]
MSRNSLVLYYDVVSPWSNVAFAQLTRYSKIWSIPLELRPMNLGYVMKTSGNKPPITVPNKGRWMRGEMARAGTFYGVNLGDGPTEFPFNSFPAMCALRVIKADYSPEVLHSVTAHLFDRVWSNGIAFNSLDVVAKELGGAGDGVLTQSDVEKIIAKAGSKELRTLLNDEAVKLVEEGGAFGAPWIVATRAKDGSEATFFGSDRLEHIAAYLELPYRGPLGDGQTFASKL